jgi:feruloyl esterase
MHTRLQPLTAGLTGLALLATLAGCGADDDAVQPAQLSPARPAAFSGTCDTLQARLAGLANTTITAAQDIAAGTLTVGGQPVPAHCRVTGTMFQRTSAVDGNSYAIGFEMRLPLAWNGRFFHQGNGGIDGSVVTATGSSGGGPLTHALHQGFAVLSSDAGHAGALGPTFGIDPQARLDYGYQAVGTLTPMAKAAIALAYGKGPDRSYFGGCSNGGRHALVAAARYAEDYDGILAGAPGYNLPLAALANIWSGQRYATVATGDPLTPPGLETAFTATERRMVASRVLARCDALDGAVDGIVQDTAACQRNFKLMRDVNTCARDNRDGTCLTIAQKRAIDPIFRGGARTSDGERFYAGFPYDPGIGGGGVPFWEFTAPLVLDSSAVGVIFKVPPAPESLTNGPGFALGLDIDIALGELYATDATYTESAMSFMTPPNPTDMSAVRDRGGKILIYHGVADPIFSVSDSEAFVRGVNRASRGQADAFLRLFNVPGMGHCSGGPTTDQADYLTPLVAWVEQGQAPDRIVASARGPGNPGGVNSEVPPTWAPDRTRPLCPFPAVARYDGSGDVERAESWACVNPRGGQ